MKEVLAVVDAENGIGVADVDDQQHAFALPRKCRDFAALELFRAPLAGAAEQEGTLLVHSDGRPLHVPVPEADGDALPVEEGPPLPLGMQHGEPSLEERLVCIGKGIEETMKPEWIPTKGSEAYKDYYEPLRAAGAILYKRLYGKQDEVEIFIELSR